MAYPGVSMDEDAVYLCSGNPLPRDVDAIMQQLLNDKFKVPTTDPPPPAPRRLTPPSRVCLSVCLPLPVCCVCDVVGRVPFDLVSVPAQGLLAGRPAARRHHRAHSHPATTQGHRTTTPASPWPLTRLIRLFLPLLLLLLLLWWCCDPPHTHRWWRTCMRRWRRWSTSCRRGPRRSCSWPQSWGPSPPHGTCWPEGGREGGRGIEGGRHDDDRRGGA